MNSPRSLERNWDVAPEETRVPLRGLLAVLAFALVCLGENFFNIARYMADARAQDLPLVGNGDHDWAEIFLRWGVLHLDGRIAGLTRGIGVVLILGAVAWLFQRWLADRDDSAP